MKQALLVAALIALAAVAAHADIRSLMRAKGYAAIPSAAECGAGCQSSSSTATASVEEPSPTPIGCTLPAVLPCVL